MSAQVQTAGTDAEAADGHEHSQSTKAATELPMDEVQKAEAKAYAADEKDKSQEEQISSLVN